MIVTDFSGKIFRQGLKGPAENLLDVKTKIHSCALSDNGRTLYVSVEKNF